MLELNRLYNMDCMEGMSRFSDKFFDLAIVDPPYGKKEHGGKSRSSFATQKNGSKSFVKDGNYRKKDWDNEVPGVEYFMELMRVSKHQIIWGCNYFPIVLGSGRIVWDKVNGDSDQSDCEIAYNSMTNRVDLFRYMWAGMMQGKSAIEGHIMQGNKALNERRIHPTQKPVELYRWILSKYASSGMVVLNTHSGSGSQEIACEDLGFEYVAFEIDEDYYSDAKARVLQFHKKLKLF